MTRPSPAEAPRVLELAGVTRRWRAGILGAATEVTALASCSLTLRAGEIAAVTGPAGAGKSTLLLVAAGKVAPSAGTARWGAVDDAAGSRAQFVAARPWEYGHLTVRQALAFHADVLALADAALPAPTRFVPLMLRVGLRGMARVRIGQLDALDKLRVVLAQALLARPRLLCCDEPFAYCGPVQRQEGAALLRALARSGLAVLVTARDEETLAALGPAARHYQLVRGRLVDGAAGAVAGAVAGAASRRVLELAVSRVDEAMTRLLPRLPSLARRGRRLRVPLGGTSPEAVLAVCRAAGVAVRASRVAEDALPREPLPGRAASP